MAAATAASACPGLLTIAAADPLAEALGAPGAFGTVVMAQQVGAGVGVLVGGVLVDRYGPSRTLAAGTLTSVAAASLTSVLAWFWPAVALRFAGGMGAGTCQAVALAAVALLGRPHQRVRLYGISSAVWGVAGLTVPAAVAWLAGRGGWRAPVALEATVAVGTLAAFRLAVPAATEGAGPPPGPRAAGPLLAWRHVVGRRLVPLHLAGIASFLGPWGVHAALPVVVTDGFGRSAAMGSWALTLSSLGWLGGSLAGAGPLARRSTAAVLGLSLAGQAAVLAAGAAGSGGSLVLLLAVGTLAGFLGGIGNNAAVALVSTVLSRGQAGRGLAAFQFLRSVGTGLGSAGAGVLVAAAPVAGLRAGQAGAATVGLAAVAAVRRATTDGGGAGGQEPVTRA